MQDVNHMSSTHAGRIVNSRVGETGNIAELLGARFRELLHFRFGAKVQAAGRTRLDASRLEAHRNAVAT